METNFWLTRWQDQQIGFHQPQVNHYLQTYWEHTGTAAPGQVFVPLCGKSADMVWLHERGHTVLGVEVSPIAVQAFFAENNLTPEVRQAGDFEHWQNRQIELLCGDYFKLTKDHLSDVKAVYDRASLIAFPPEMRAEYIKHCHRILPANTSILLITLEYDPAEMDGPPFSVTEEELAALYQPYYRIQRLVAKDVVDEDEYQRFRQRGLTRLQEKVFLLKR